MNRAWLATGTAALLAAATFTVSATAASARDDHHPGNAPSFRSGPAPAVRHFESAPQFRSGGAPTVRHFESAPHFSRGPVSTPRHVETLPPVRTSPQARFNGGYAFGGERHVLRHHRFHAPIFVTIPHVYEPGYYADDECYVWQQALTPLGWRYVWMNICGDDDY